jgi:hypothetical protein
MSSSKMPKSKSTPSATPPPPIPWPEIRRVLETLPPETLERIRHRLPQKHRADFDKLFSSVVTQDAGKSKDLNDRLISSVANRAVFE